MGGDEEGDPADQDQQGCGDVQVDQQGRYSSGQLEKIVDNLLGNALEEKC